MTSKTQVTIKMDVETAKSVQEILFDAQKGYTHDETSVPPRIVNIRKVIEDISSNL